MATDRMMMASLPPQTKDAHPLVNDWLHTLQNHGSSNENDDPNYYLSNPQTLITNSKPVKFSLGNGHQILTSILPTCLSTTQELILVTCFWAKSTSQEAISSMLEKLSTKALSQNRKIQVRICFSSYSITQKLFQTSSLNGTIYPPSSWASLGLPDPSRLGGLELVVKSVFVRPFSVMHPKFIIVDRKIAFMPSCNVSWESWFEGCIELQGGICNSLFEFWERFWARGGADLPPLSSQNSNANSITSTLHDTSPSLQTPAQDLDLINYRTFNSHTPTQTILLPSPHHLNPRFTISSINPFTLSSGPPPQTPLNTFLLTSISSATKTIYLQTPNLTSYPVLSALLSALSRGVSVTIITSSRLMILEQLGTAFTITEICVWLLIRKYRALVSRYTSSTSLTTTANSSAPSTADPEAQLLPPGSLKIGYYTPRSYSTSDHEAGSKEPVKSHLKLTIVDEEVVVLGSGNMDRASWWTSQELGVVLMGREIAEGVVEAVEVGLRGRVRYVSV